MNRVYRVPYGSKGTKRQRTAQAKSGFEICLVAAAPTLTAVSRPKETDRGYADPSLLVAAIGVAFLRLASGRRSGHAIRRSLLGASHGKILARRDE